MAALTTLPAVTDEIRTARVIPATYAFVLLPDFDAWNADKNLVVQPSCPAELKLTPTSRAGWILSTCAESLRLHSSTPWSPDRNHPAYELCILDMLLGKVNGSWRKYQSCWKVFFQYV